MLTFETTHEYYLGSDPDIYYCKEHECLLVTPDHSDTIRLHGLDKETMLSFAKKLIHFDLEETDSKYEDKDTTKEETNVSSQLET